MGSVLLGTPQETGKLTSELLGRGVGQPGTQPPPPVPQWLRVTPGVLTPTLLPLQMFPNQTDAGSCQAQHLYVTLRTAWGDGQGTDI